MLREIGVTADRGSDLAGIGRLRNAAEKNGASVHVIAPVGGMLSRDKQSEIVERTLLTVRSIEFDALVVAAKTAPSNDIKLVLLLQEAYRHSKAVGAWADGTSALAGAGIPLDGPRVVIGGSAARPFADELFAAVGLHRTWQRAADVMASAVPPAR